MSRGPHLVNFAADPYAFVWAVKIGLTMRRSGIIITLIGIGLFLISIFLSEGYNPRGDIISNMYAMELVIDPGRNDSGGFAVDSYQKDKKGLTPMPPLLDTRIEGRLSIPLTVLLSLSTMITLIGVGIILSSKKQR